MAEVGRSDVQMSFLCVSLVAEEKKSLKRTFQQIQEEEDDDYPGSYSPQDPTAGPLLVRGAGQAWGGSDSHLPCGTTTRWSCQQVKRLLWRNAGGVGVLGRWNRCSLHVDIIVSLLGDFRWP